MTTWNDDVLGMIFQFYGLAFFTLGTAAFVLPKSNMILHFARHLNWLAGFGILHGLFELFSWERLQRPAFWLDITTSLLLVSSFMMLLEFGRRCWNSALTPFKLRAAPLYSSLAIALILFVFPEDEPLSLLVMGAHYLLGAPSAWLTAYVLMSNRHETVPSPFITSLPSYPCLHAATVAFIVYGFLTLVPSLDYPLVTSSLPSSRDFFRLTGLPVQVPKMLCVFVIALSFVALIRNAGRLNQTNLMQVLNSLNGFVYRCRNDRQWSMIYITEGVEAITGYPAQAFLSGIEINLGELIHPDDAERVWNSVEEALVDDREFEIGYRIRTRSGEERWVYDCGRGVRARNGRLHYIEGQICDDTARRQAEINLRINNAAIEASINAIAMANLDADIFYVNQAFADLWRLPDTSHALGRSPQEFLAHPEQAKTIKETLLGHGKWQGDLLGKRYDGTTVEVQLACYLAREINGDPLCMIGIFNDISERLEAQRELQRERDFATGLLNTAPVIVLLLDPEGRIRYVNPYFERLTGFDLNGIENRDWFETFLPEDDRTRIRHLFKRIVDDGSLHGNVNPILIRSGERRQIEWHSQTMFDDPGRITGVLVIGLDVTDQLRINQDLIRREAELEQFKATLDQTLDSVFMFDADTLRFTYCNQGAVNHLGYSAEELLGLHPYDLKPEFSERQFRALIASLRSGERDRLTFESIHRHRDGREMPVDILLQYVEPSDEAPRFVSVVRDISKRKHAEQALHNLNRELERRILERTAELERQSRRNAYIVDAAMDGFFSADRQGRVIDCNDAYCQMLGYLREELLTLSIPDIEAIETQEEIQTHIATLIAEGQDRFDTRHRRKDGTLIDVEVNVMLKHIEDQPQFFAFVSDISERKRSEALLINARKDAERANQAKSEFLSRMSHELRTPLNAILGFGQLLESDPDRPLSQMQADNVQEILRAGDHLLALVNEVLDLSRIESGHISITLEPLPVADIIQSCIKQISVLAERRGIQIRCNLQQDCIVLADPIRLKEVLLNLLSNAVKYNREGGRVDVASRRIDDVSIEVAITDTGPGIPAEFMPRLFRPFERLESAYQGIEGTGIGLALVKRLVEAMDGEIGVASRPDEGSKFWFTLRSVDFPAQTLPDLSAASPEPRPPAEIGHSHQILYVEDNPSNLKLLQKMLATRPNLELLTAINGTQGLQVAGQRLPELILLDLNLPDMDGFEVLRRLRNDADTRHIPVVAVTANALPGDIERGIQAGFADYLTKPIEMISFLTTIERIVRQSNSID